jgi:predicted O-methyltransferase YrrM
LHHYPRFHGEIPASWSWPPYLNDKTQWLGSLKRLYELPISFPASVSPEAGLLLHGLIRNLQPRLIVETGTFISVSTHWIAGALLENGFEPTDFGRIHCFDDFAPIYKGPYRDVEMLEGRQEFVRESLTAAGLIDYIRVHVGDSSTNIRNIVGPLRKAGGVDFAFIDGDHSKKGATADFRAIDSVMNTGGYILVHDTFPEQAGGYAGPRYIMDHVDELSNTIYEKIELYIAPFNYGMGLLRRIG